jgi:hypothetical protein
MENSPPGIHTIPSGVGPGGVFLPATVGRNPLGGVDFNFAESQAPPAMPTTINKMIRTGEFGRGLLTIGWIVAGRP